MLRSTARRVKDPYPLSVATSPKALADLSYPTARRLMLFAGLGVLAITAAVMYARRVDTVEVTAVLLFMPVFLGFVVLGVAGGIVAGLGAAAAYVVLRLPAIDAVGLGELQGLLLSRAAAYVAFGAIGGWAAGNLEKSLEKLDLYDQIDDASGLFNARFFVQHTELEIARAQRYSTLFSVAVVDVPEMTVAALNRRKRNVFIRDLGQLLKDSVRTVDRAAHCYDGARHRFAVVLPETANEGARIFAERLAGRVEDEMRKAGAESPVVAHQSLTFPGDDDALASLRGEFAWVDKAEHPESPAIVDTPGR